MAGVALETERVLQQVPSENLASRLASSGGRRGGLPCMREQRHRKQGEQGAADGQTQKIISAFLLQTNDAQRGHIVSPTDARFILRQS